MKGLRYTIPEISAQCILSSTKKTEAGYVFRFDASDPSKEYLVDMTLQYDCPIFYQTMCVLHGDNFKKQAVGVCKDLSDVFVYVDFSGIFDRNPVGRVAEQQKMAEYLFRPEGIFFDFGKGAKTYLAFERSASMSRESKLSFIRDDFYEPVRERMMLGLQIGMCQLSKLYAYNGLMFTGGRRIDEFELNAKHIIVIDNPKSIVPNVNTITVEDDGTVNAVRKYTRTEKMADIAITEFDGEGLVSAELAKRLDPWSDNGQIHHSFQIRMPYIKGVVHEVDFKSLFAELGVNYITDIAGEQHSVSDVDMILTKSMFKGYGWMQENGLSWADYIGHCRKYHHSLYISNMDSAEKQEYTELNYQFLNTAAVTEDEFRPKDLPLGWTHNPEWDRRNWLTKATETAYFGYISDNGERRKYFIKDCDRTDLEMTDRRKLRAKLIEKNGLYIEESIFAKELKDKAEQTLSKYALGKLLIAGDNRYLSDDLMRLLTIIVKPVSQEAYTALESECLSGAVAYAPQPSYAENKIYTLLRNPHISRNEEAIVKPLREVGNLREKYLSHLHYVVMVDSRSLIPERLGGADYDGDMVKTVSDPMLNHCIARNYSDNFEDADNLPLLKIPTVEPLMQDANDWHSRFNTVKSTFSSRVGQISNAALNRSIIAYDENSDSEERESCRKETEILAILTGLEIDSAKSGIKPDLSKYLEKRKTKRSAFLRYKSIVDKSENAKWYEPTISQKLDKFFASVDWDAVSSNLEKVPYYARMLEQSTQKWKPIPAKDEALFIFAADPEWKAKLNPKMMEHMASLIADYEEAFRRCRYLHIDTEYMSRKSDIQRILFARNQENVYLVDELYHSFDRVSPQEFRKSRRMLTDCGWIYTPPEERETVLFSMMPLSADMSYADLFCDFRNSGYRVFGDIICDFDDVYRKRGIQKHLTAQKGDSKDLIFMLHGIVNSRDYKADIIKSCVMVMQPPNAKERFDFAEAVKCAIALGKRQFALEVLPGILLELTLDRSHIYEQHEETKKGWRLFK